MASSATAACRTNDEGAGAPMTAATLVPLGASASLGAADTAMRVVETSAAVSGTTQYVMAPLVPSRMRRREHVARREVPPRGT